MSLKAYRGQMLKRAAIALTLLVACPLAVPASPAYFRISLGLLIGGLCSMLVFWLKVGEVLGTTGIPRRQAQGRLLRRYFLNYGIMAIVLTGCGASSYVNLWAAGAGLFLCNCVIILSTAWQPGSAIHKESLQS